LIFLCIFGGFDSAAFPALDNWGYLVRAGIKNQTAVPAHIIAPADSEEPATHREFGLASASAAIRNSFSVVVYAPPVDDFPCFHTHGRKLTEKTKQSNKKRGTTTAKKRIHKLSTSYPQVK